MIKYLSHIILATSVIVLFIIVQVDFNRTKYAISSIEFKTQPLYISKLSLVKDIQPLVNEKNEKALYKIEKALNKNPWIEKAQVFINPKNRKINIQFQERTPAIRLYSQKGIPSYIDYDYKMMPLPEGKTPYSTICMNVPEKMISADVLSEIIEWSRLIKSTPSIATHFSYLRYSDRTKIELIPKEGSPSIILPLKKEKKAIIKSLAYLYDKVIPTIGWHYYSSLNFMYKQQIVATRSKKI